MRRNLLLERQAAAWRRSPPSDPVIAAGLTGGIPAITKLLSVVAVLSRGAVILPGLDRRADEAEWRAIERDEAHPQYLLALLLRALEVAPAEVPDWPPPLLPVPSRENEMLADLPLFAAAAARPPALDPASPDRRFRSADETGQSPRARRMRLVGEALRPAATTDAWRHLPPQPADTFDGVSRFDCTSAQHEAVTIALLLRRKLETLGATAALVTPDRELARRVAVELRRWGIEIDNLAGVPLKSHTARRLPAPRARSHRSRLAPVPLLAALKHPLAAGGLDPVVFRDRARRLEKQFWGPARPRALPVSERRCAVKTRIASVCRSARCLPSAGCPSCSRRAPCRSLAS